MWILPDRFAVLAPIAVQRPARQLLARVPLALAEVSQSGRGILILQALIESGCQLAFCRTERRRVPLRAIRIVDGHEGWFAAHGQSHIQRLQIGIYRMAQ